MQGRPIFLLDMDGVLVDVSSTQMLPALNEEFGTDYQPEDLKDFDYYQYMEDKHADFMIEQWHDPKRYEGAEPLEGAEAGVDRLQELGRVVVSTSPMIGHASSKMQWLEDFGIPRHDIALVPDKENLLIGDVMIDDGPHHAGPFPGYSILFDQPYNRGLDQKAGRNGLVRVYDWDQLVEEVEYWFTRYWRGDTHGC